MYLSDGRLAGLCYNFRMIVGRTKTIGFGTAMGIIIGTVIGALTDNDGLWIAIGIVVGAGVGSLMAKKGSTD